MLIAGKDRILNRTLLGFIKKELTQTLRDPRMRFVLFVVPMVQMTLFGIAVSNEVKNIRLAIDTNSEDTVLRSIYDHAIQSRWFIPADGTQETDPFRLVQSGKADAVLVALPGGFTKAINGGNAKLQLLIDATNVTQAQGAENYLKAIIKRTVALELKQPTNVPVIQIDTRVLFNPALETSIFMVPGVMCTLMVMTTLVLTLSGIVREKEVGTFEMLISAPVKVSEIIYGKTLPYVLLGMLNLPLVLSVAVFVFHVPLVGHLWVLAIAAFSFVCTAVAMGALISTFCQNQQQANLASFLFMFPAIMFSGLMFPIENMPGAVRWVAFIDPLAHYLGLLRNIMLKGGGTNYVISHVITLFIMASILTWISFKRIRTHLS